MLCLGLKVRLQRHTKVFQYITVHGRGKFLKRIVINLPPTEDNEINMIHSYVQNHISYVGSHKRFLI